MGLPKICMPLMTMVPNLSEKWFMRVLFFSPNAKQTMSRSSVDDHDQYDSRTFRKLCSSYVCLNACLSALQLAASVVGLGFPDPAPALKCNAALGYLGMMVIFSACTLIVNLSMQRSAQCRLHLGYPVLFCQRRKRG